MFKNLRIKWQLLGIGSAILIVPVLLIAYFAITKSAEGFTKLSSEELESRAVELAQTVDLLIDANERMIVETARSHLTVRAAENVRDNSKDMDYFINELNLELKKVNSNEGIYKYIQTFLVVDAKGRCFASNLPEQYTGLNISDRGYFAEAMKGNDHIGSIIENKVTGEYFIPFASPIR